MSGGKKFNIWIAYSDLFTNLSTFLFISALGIFAAIGSGAFGQMGPRGSDGCTASSQVGQAMTKYSQWMEYVGSRPTSRSSCSEYYRLKDVSFKIWSPARGYLQYKGGELKRPELLKHICEPIWLAIVEPDSRRYNARVVLLGSGTANSAMPYEPKCEQLAWGRPRIGNLEFRTGHAAREAVEACYSGSPRGGPSNAFCRSLEKCRDPELAKDYSMCGQVAAARQWDDNASRACRREVARLQAGTLHRACALAPTDPDFRDGLVERIMNSDASNIETLADQWARVDFSAPVEGRSPQRSAPPSQPGGSLLVELRFSR
jgi:hypothetical protein